MARVAPVTMLAFLATLVVIANGQAYGEYLILVMIGVGRGPLVQPPTPAHLSMFLIL